MLFTMAQLHDLIFPRRARARPRLETVTGFPRAQAHGVGNVSSPIQHRRAAARSCVAPVAHVASGSHVVSADVASKRGVTCSRAVLEPAGIARCGIKTCRQGARWRCQMWRQNVASRSRVASPDVAFKMWRHVASPDVASKCGVTCPRGVRQPGGVAGVGTGFAPMASPGVRAWRRLLTWRQRATWRRRTWRQNVASGVNTWRPGGPSLSAGVFKTCLELSGDMCTPTGDPPAFYVCLCKRRALLSGVCIGAPPCVEMTLYCILAQLSYTSRRFTSVSVH